MSEALQPTPEHMPCEKCDLRLRKLVGELQRMCFELESFRTKVDSTWVDLSMADRHDPLAEVPELTQQMYEEKCTAYTGSLLKFDEIWLDSIGCCQSQKCVVPDTLLSDRDTKIIDIRDNPTDGNMTRLVGLLTKNLDGEIADFWQSNPEAR